MAFVPVFATCLLLAAVSVTEVGLVSDMVSFLHIQKWFVKTYQINWPNESIPFGALPAHLWLDQGHTTNGAAGYGFVLGVFGLFVAWRQRNRNGKVSSIFTNRVISTSIPDAQFQAPICILQEKKSRFKPQNLILHTNTPSRVRHAPSSPSRSCFSSQPSSPSLLSSSPSS